MDEKRTYGKSYVLVEDQDKKHPRTKDESWTSDALLEILCYVPHLIDLRLGGEEDDEDNTLARIGKWCVYVGVILVFPLFVAPIFILLSKMKNRVVWCTAAFSLILAYAAIIAIIAWACSKA